jgi:hypothetical protein
MVQEDINSPGFASGSVDALLVYYFIADLFFSVISVSSVAKIL